uniref:Uncharacterized protein n=1 Tax=Auxenochlorella protothecoides TaxID=3075 RepID=A0A1D2A3Y1_AUXPR
MCDAWRGLLTLVLGVPPRQDSGRQAHAWRCRKTPPLALSISVTTAVSFLPCTLPALNPLSPPFKLHSLGSQCFPPRPHPREDFMCTGAWRGGLPLPTRCDSPPALT